MARSLYLLFVYLAILGIGAGAPFVFTLGYEWADLFRPQNVAWQLFPRTPVSFVLGSAAVGSYLLLDRRFPPRISALTLLTLLFSLWVTLTSIWAEVPDAAWDKWDWAFNSIMFSIFIPYVVRSRNQIEAFLQVLVFSTAANIIPFGLKSLDTGGGYARRLGLITRNFFLGEQDTLAAACVFVIPVIFYLMVHTRIIPRGRLTLAGYAGLILLAIATIVGTHERAAPLGLLVVAATFWWKSRRKFAFGAVSAAIAGLILVSAPDSWWERMSTITSPDDQSISVRLEVWQWTLDYVKDHPLGGGFDAYRTDEVEVPIKYGEYGDTRTEHARAYHSTFFEVLGEHGWPGLILFVALIASSLRALRQSARISRDRPHLLWSYDLANTLQVSLLAFLTCGVFVGFAFQPLLYYLFALSQSLREHVRRSTDTLERQVGISETGLAVARP